MQKFGSLVEWVQYIGKGVYTPGEIPPIHLLSDYQMQANPEPTPEFSENVVIEHSRWGKPGEEEAFRSEIIRKMEEIGCRPFFGQYFGSFDIRVETKIDWFPLGETPKKKHYE